MYRSGPAGPLLGLLLAGLAIYFHVSRQRFDNTLLILIALLLAYGVASTPSHRRLGVAFGATLVFAMMWAFITFM